jgi:hypothetical protein
MLYQVINMQFPEAPGPRGTVTLNVEVVPGQYRAVPVPQEMLERYVMVKLLPVPGKAGYYRMAVKEHKALVQLTDDLGDRMGWGLERRQLLALACAGMIEAYRATTGVTLIEPESVWEHIHSTSLGTDEDLKSEAQGFWTPERIAAYRDSQEFVRASGIVPASRRKEADEIDHLEFDFGEPEPAVQAAA